VEHFELLAQCIRSDQLSAQQVDLELQDRTFRAWYLERYPEIIETSRECREKDTVAATASGKPSTNAATPSLTPVRLLKHGHDAGSTCGKE
jgi:hypothetical protein